MPDTDDWEITPLSDVLTDFAERAPGRPTKGNEVDHGVNTSAIEANAELVEEGMTPLFGQDGGGGVRIQKENTRHRVLVFLFSQGGTVRDVFEQLGGKWDELNKKPISGTGEYSYQQLLNIRKQGWFQAEVIKVMSEAGNSLVEAKLALEMMASLQTLVELRDNVNEKGSVRLSAANSLLDRHLGKPSQVVKIEAPASTASHEQEANELRDQLARLKQEAADLNPAFKEES